MKINKHILFYLLFSIVTIGYLNSAFVMCDFENDNTEIAYFTADTHELFESSAEEEVFHGIINELNATVHNYKILKFKQTSLIISNKMFSIWNPPKIS